MLLTLPMAGCFTTTGTGAIDFSKFFGRPDNPQTDAAIDANAVELCKAWLPISWSSRDTEQTIAEVKSNNSARVAWGCPNEVKK